MIILTEVAQKIDNILNGRDSETSAFTNPTNLSFLVQTEGFHIDEIKKPDKSGNFIPVFISSLGGQFNPVKGLKQGSYSIPVVLYYPVRFKDAFYSLAEYLADVFVGTYLNYGTISGRAVSNISVPQYGEIQDIDFNEFEKWVGTNYKMPVETMEKYMSMTFTLFLSNAAPGLIYGNNIKVDFSFTYEETTLSVSDINWDGASLQSNSQPQSEQEEGTNEADSLPFGTAYGASFRIYPNLNTPANESTQETPVYFYKELLKVWLNGNIQELECKVKFTFGGDPDLVYERDCFIQSIITPIEKGEILALTLTLSKKVQFDDDEEEE